MSEKTLMYKKESSFQTFNILTEKLDTVYIKLEEYKYSEGPHYYYTSYKYSNPNFEFLPEDHKDGEIFIKNKLSDVLIECLFMSNEELSLISGNTTPSDYKLNIMMCISNLWD